ncbi:hypothetical protein RvY_07162 [Ramazzottius varieornatus]|uniref:Uncharacterized protein n=1 Tax=Ramazzottius varieornatus TaxID=947166 RepID=A0A1D1V135_RAMVA|nr:hypothetical protein RvY_07162 [Ramazzottius varieornatus]
MLHSKSEQLLKTQVVEEEDHSNTCATGTSAMTLRGEDVTSGFEYKIRPGRTLDFVGAKHLLALTQSQNSMTHSYTAMMCVSPGVRKSLPVLFITLQEPKGIFRPLVKKSMFKASNLYVTASTSGKMTKDLYIEWCEKVFFPHMNQHCIYSLLILGRRFLTKKP